MYVREPCTGLTEAECALVLGGGGEQWGETVDASDIEQVSFENEKKNARKKSPVAIENAYRTSR